MTRLTMALQGKSRLTIHHLRAFEKALYLALLRLMDYYEQQRSQSIPVSGLQKLMQKMWTLL
jgi:hypothetical protein